MTVTQDPVVSGQLPLAQERTWTVTQDPVVSGHLPQTQERA